MFDKKTFIIGVGIIGVICVAVLLTKSRKKGGIEIVATSANPVDVTKLHEKAVRLKEDGELAQAKETYQAILAEHSDYEKIESVQSELENLNMRMITTSSITPDVVVHEVQTGDTLGGLANKYGTTVALIKKRNNLKSDVIRLGQKLNIFRGTFNIFVDKSQNILILKKGDQVVKVYPVSTGKNNVTPIGNFIIKDKLIDPVWFHRGVIVPPESPENVLGSRWMGFDNPGYGIHGTVEPQTIGKQVTAGCVRMRNEDVEELYDLIPLGTKVVVVD